MNVEKKTKIVATIGPATESVEQLSNLLKAGFNVMRLNFSHGDFTEHQKKVDNLRTAMKKTGITAAILQDLAGPKIRIGDFKTTSVTLKEGQTFTITTDQIEGDETRVSCNYKPLPKEVKVGGYIMMHDGKKKLLITDIKGNDVITKVIIGGDIKGRRGLNLPGAYLSVASLTDKDKKDIDFGIKNDVDFFAFSFVRRPSDVIELREILNKRKSKARIIAKIEDQEAIENIDKLIALVDGVMIGRGDLAIEIGAENMPLTQKMITAKCNAAGKPVITATQILESMIKSATPTRAEVSDIANAIFEGTDAIMLSEETTLGEYPVKSVETMALVSKTVESGKLYQEHVLDMQKLKHAAIGSGVADALTNEVVDIANAVNAKAIVALTESGFTARMISRYKPLQPLVAFTPNEKTHNQLLLSFGVTPVKIEKVAMLNDAIKIAKAYLTKNKIATKGDKIVIAAGAPFGKKIDTNMLLVETL
ncbi:MAG: pyruvate kinase [Candidatus Paceibacter sp.]|jgi:pyruvate kinase|nr:pyruvate kinase [Candidatus Paceibacter sp.]